MADTASTSHGRADAKAAIVPSSVRRGDGEVVDVDLRLLRARRLDELGDQGPGVVGGRVEIDQRRPQFP